MQWSEYQNAIFDAFLKIFDDPRDLVVMARAGTGKTTTVIEAVVRAAKAFPRRRFLTCAFNKKNAVELADRLDSAGLNWRQASARTLNAVGLATIKKEISRSVEVDAKKGRKIARDLADAWNDERRKAGLAINPGLYAKVARLATLGKITLTNERNVSALSDLGVMHGVSDDDAELTVISLLASEAMTRAKADLKTVDFDDQIWLPAVLRLRPWAYDVVVVDEAQDMNPAQLALARASVKRGGRLVAVGDDRQAIYGWRGADSGFMDRMIRDLGAKTLLLPRTYRCGRLIVDEARRIVPDYEAAEGNHEGVVRDLKDDRLVSELRPGDFVISRVNASLLPICLELLARKVPAAIQGRDVLGQIRGIVERSECTEVPCLLEYVAEYEDREIDRILAVDPDAESAVADVRDRCAVIRILASEHVRVIDFLDHLEQIFTDQDDLSRVTLSSAHRSKGLERDRVFLLRKTFRSGGQEDNCRYVAITRAKHELVYVG